MKYQCAILLTAAFVSCQPEEVGTLRLDSKFTVSTQTMEFGSAAVGSQHKQTLSIFHMGDVPLLIEASLSGTSRGHFSIQWMTHPLAVNQGTMMEVSYQPTIHGTHNATLLLMDQADPKNSIDISLSGLATTPDCNDDNPCTDDSFDLLSGTCKNTAHTRLCDDNNRCTGRDTCLDGRCVGTALSCNDGIDCTEDYCDPDQGCIQQPNDSLCGDAAGCEINSCQPEQGCITSMAEDGTLCAPFNCAELSVCISGRCKTGPTPDGMPCDDGDMCSTGDQCQSGSCVAGTTNNGTAVGNPIEVDFYALANTAEDQAGSIQIAEVVGARLHPHGGLDVVWTSYPSWQAEQVQYYRSHIDNQGQVLSTRYLTAGILASVAFLGDNLVLAVHGCRDCPFSACFSQVLQYRLDGTLEETYCLQIGWDALGLSVAVQDGAIHVAHASYLLVDSETPTMQIVLTSYQSGSQVEERRLLHHQQSSLPNSSHQVRDLQLRSINGQLWLAFSQVQQVASVQCCAAANCDEQEHWGWGGTILTDLFSTPHATYILGGPIRNIAMSDLEGQGLVLAERTIMLDNLCHFQDGFSSFEITTANNQLLVSDLLLNPYGTHSIKAASLLDTMAGVLLNFDGSLGILQQSSGQEPTILPVANPQDRSYALGSGPRDTLATIPLDGGFVVVARTTHAINQSQESDFQVEMSPDSIAFFTVGCDARIPSASAD